MYIKELALIKTTIYKKGQFRRASSKVVIQTSQPTTQRKGGIEIKDLLIPLASALIAVYANQLFFVENKLTEAQIKMEAEAIEKQRPALNRILAFTYKYEETTMTFVNQKVQVIEYYDTKGNLLKTEESKLDSAMFDITAPTFVFKKQRRNTLLADIEKLKEYRDYLDHNVYVSLDRLITYLENHELPEIDNNEAIVQSEWKNKEVIDEWNSLISDLRTKTYKVFNSLFE